MKFHNAQIKKKKVACKCKIFFKMIKIKNLKIGKNAKPVIIAEMSGNHNRSLKRALKIVDAAAASGARMLKLQTYTADTMTINSNSKDFLLEIKKSLVRKKFI